MGRLIDAEEITKEKRDAQRVLNDSSGWMLLDHCASCPVFSAITATRLPYSGRGELLIRYGYWAVISADPI